MADLGSIGLMTACWRFSRGCSLSDYGPQRARQATDYQLAQV